MKKQYLIFLLPALLLLGGCESGNKIKTFWAGQAQKLLTTPYGMVMLAGMMQYSMKAQQNLKMLEVPPQAAADMPWMKQPQPTATPAPATVPQPAAPAPVPQAATSKPKPQQQAFMEISLEEETPQFKGKASIKDQQAMRQSIDLIKSTNQQAVGDVQRLMGNAARDEVIRLNTRTEKNLEKASLQARTLKQYQQQQNAILQQYKVQFQKILAKYQSQLNK